METSLFSLREKDIERLREKKIRLALGLERVMADRQRLLSVILFSDVLVNIPLVLLCLYLSENLPGLPLLPVWVITLVLFALVVVICDLLPKLLALGNPLRLAPLAVRYLDFALPALGNVTGLLEKTTERLAVWLTPKKSKVASFFPRAR